MTFERNNIGYFIIFVILGGILGSALGTLLVHIFPVLSILKINLTAPVGFSIEIITFQLRLNLASILGIAAGIFLFRKV